MKTDVKVKLYEYLVSTVLNGDPRGLKNDTDLVASGLLDSFALIEFVQYIEEEFHIGLDHGQINAESFKSIETIADMVSKALEGQHDVARRIG
jgi:acyl carrier protein